MTTTTYELLIPGITSEIERRAAHARHGAPTRPAHWSLARWLRDFTRGAKGASRTS